MHYRLAIIGGSGPIMAQGPCEVEGRQSRGARVSRLPTFDSAGALHCGPIGHWTLDPALIRDRKPPASSLLVSGSSRKNERDSGLGIGMQREAKVSRGRAAEQRSRPNPHASLFAVVNGRGGAALLGPHAANGRPKWARSVAGGALDRQRRPCGR